MAHKVVLFYIAWRNKNIYGNKNDQATVKYIVLVLRRIKEKKNSTIKLTYKIFYDKVLIEYY